MQKWWDKSWNPVTGCTKVSEGCAHCWAHGMSGRFEQIHGPGPFDKMHFHPDRLNEPLKVRKPSRIFVCSMGDLFHPNVGLIQTADIVNIFNRAPQHTYIILTKRPENMLEMIGTWSPPENVWLGVTCENQARADERIPILLQTPAAVRFISIEPMLGPVDLTQSLKGCYDWGGSEGLDWTICGPETGPRKRPFNEDWARSLRNKCKAVGVPFFYKGGLLDGVKHEEFPAIKTGRA